jgi:hypothetical protein
MSEPYGPTVAVDFDGVIHSYTSGWTGPEPIDPPREGALKFITDLIVEGYKVVYHTARADCALHTDAVISWLVRHDFPRAEVTNVKPKAIAYVDDRAVYAGPGVGWSAVLSRIEALSSLHTGEKR